MIPGGKIKDMRFRGWKAPVPFVVMHGTRTGCVKPRFGRFRLTGMYPSMKYTITGYALSI